MKNLTAALKALGDTTRLRIACLLSIRPLCVCQLMEILNISQPKASRHLAVLRQAGLVACSKKAQWSWYQATTHPLLDAVCSLAGDTEQAGKDRARMESLDLEKICEKPLTPIERSNDND